MEILPAMLCFSLSFPLFFPASIAQPSSTETRILLHIQQILEYPEPLQGWNNWTRFCFLTPSPNLVIRCSENHVTEFSVTGKASSSGKPLSSKFSIDSLFTDITKLSRLRRLSLVSLGLWGPLPPKINRLKSLAFLNLSSNSIHGEVPSSIPTMTNLKSLDLGNNLFNGSVPDLRGLTNLEELDLGNNHIGPDFPQLSDKLLTVNLKNNSLRSRIPSEIEGFDLLQKFDTSSNKLVGPIPSPLFSLSSIRYLNLADNQFSGALPANMSCNSNLTFVNISKNLLIGNLPACLGSGSKSRIVLSMWNCLASGGSKYQHPNRFCHKEAIAVQPPATDRKAKSGIRLGLIIGIIGGIVVAVIAVGLLILVILRRAERKNGNDFKREGFAFDKPSIRGSPIIDESRVPRSVRSTALGVPPYHVFTLEEMEDATNNFDSSNLVGGGSQGQGALRQLYKGWLRDGSMVIVKCLKLKQKQLSSHNLQQHMEVISRLRHRHLVSVLGHSIVTYQDQPTSHSATTVFIVLEHVSNGSLRDHLLDWKRREYLKWPQRMGIIMGIARGIQFLHTGMAPGIYGNDLKIDNILLDDTLTAKISSYSISLPSRVGSGSPLVGQDASTRLNSTEDPEKNDIYQFGVILLEVLTGKPITSESALAEQKLELETSLAESPSRLREATDPSIQGTFAYDSLKTTVEIAMKCLCEDPGSRPTIEDVLWHLQYSIQIQEGWTSSGNLNTKL